MPKRCWNIAGHPCSRQHILHKIYLRSTRKVVRLADHNLPNKIKSASQDVLTQEVHYFYQEKAELLP